MQGISHLLQAVFIVVFLNIAQKKRRGFLFRFKNGRKTFVK